MKIIIEDSYSTLTLTREDSFGNIQDAINLFYDSLRGLGYSDVTIKKYIDLEGNIDGN